MLNYWFLLLLLPLLAFLYPKKYYVKHIFSLPLKKSYPFHNVFWWLGYLTLVLAALNITFSESVIRVKDRVRKYVLIDDASGSMTDSIHAQGITQGIQTVLDGNYALMDELGKKGRKDLVGVVLFSDNAFILSHFVDDYAFIKRKLQSVIWNQSPLAEGTSMSNGLWSGLEVVFKDYFNEEQVRSIMSDLARTKYQADFSNVNLIAFTDGSLTPADQAIVIKIIELCKKFKIRVYIISLGRMGFDIESALRQTGGNILVAATYNKQIYRDTYVNIVNTQPKEEVVYEEKASHSLSPFFAIISLICMFVWFYLNKSITEI